MATYKKTATSSDIGKEPDIDTLFINPATDKAASIYANPMQLLGGLSKPSTLQGAVQAGLAGIRSGMAMPTASPEASALTGILTGLAAGPAYEQQFMEQQMANIDMLPIEQISPSLVEAFPEARGIPLGTFQKLSGIFSAMTRQKALVQESVFGPEDIDFIKDYLTGKRYSQEDIERMAPTYIGRTLAQLKSITPTERLARQDIVNTPKYNDFGIPVAVEQFDKISKKTSIQPLKENAAVTAQIQKIASGKKMLEVLYDTYRKILSPAQQRAFAEALSDGYENTAFIEGGEAGFIQRFRGVVEKALLKPAFGGREGEKLNAFRASLEANIPMIARSLGHTGVLTELDVMKSFGIAPDITGTALENVMRQRIYNDLTKAQIDAIMGSYVPYYGEQPDMNKLYKKLGIGEISQLKTSKPMINDFSDETFTEFMKGR